MLNRSIKDITSNILPHKKAFLGPNLSKRIPPIYIHIKVDNSLIEIILDNCNLSYPLERKNGTNNNTINDTLKKAYVAFPIKNFFKLKLALSFIITVN